MSFVNDLKLSIGVEGIELFKKNYIWVNTSTSLIVAIKVKLQSVCCFLSWSRTTPMSFTFVMQMGILHFSIKEFVIITRLKCKAIMMILDQCCLRIEQERNGNPQLLPFGCAQHKTPTPMQ
ncbi:hypothetical protein H5410_046753 [Solanum commersonii]|uniref:Uncharacterized protein n=1 Tax=Solanum commersonii TaxID=4109 RepID=A0A9J5XFB0_SOLCO|nr:hypothetical protein H5410_046753 [Solanum commersonii]